MLFSYNQINIYLKRKVQRAYAIEIKSENSECCGQFALITLNEMYMIILTYNVYENKLANQDLGSIKSDKTKYGTVDSLKFLIIYLGLDEVSNLTRLES